MKDRRRKIRTISLLPLSQLSIDPDSSRRLFLAILERAVKALYSPCAQGYQCDRQLTLHWLRDEAEVTAEHLGLDLDILQRFPDCCCLSAKMTPQYLRMLRKSAIKK